MDLKDTIIKQLSAPVKRKGTQEYITDEDGIIDPALQDLAPMKHLA